MKNISCLFLGLSIFVGGCFAQETLNPCDIKIGEHSSVTPVAQDPNLVKWWPSRHKEKLEEVKQKKGNVDLLMIGDSITHRWENDGNDVWQKYYANRKPLNIGFGGDRTQHVLWRLQNGEIEGISPKLGVLMIGTNRATTETPQMRADGIKAIVSELRNKLPNTKILVLGVFPRGSSKQRKSKIGDAEYNERWEQNDKINEIICNLADDKMIYYLDIGKIFLSDKGLVSRDVLPDLVHPNQKGYQAWAEAMEPKIAELMGEKK
ncbi:MAG: hypothetical protein A2Y10_09125 [Planctomycetes bacterium GWF2_41_51]|nr:MAG: hypothetical protein A2Y10_09125 [Planctomycetes bacterium GWF2_41_51]HBG26703.1 hypothetical protein [Phycisphaerales bacterium]